MLSHPTPRCSEYCVLALLFLHAWTAMRKTDIIDQTQAQCNRHAVKFSRRLVDIFSGGHNPFQITKPIVQHTLLGKHTKHFTIENISKKYASSTNRIFYSKYYFTPMPGAGTTNNDNGYHNQLN